MRSHAHTLTRSTWEIEAYQFPWFIARPYYQSISIYPDLYCYVPAPKSKLTLNLKSSQPSALDIGLVARNTLYFGPMIHGKGLWSPTNMARRC
jgi:hypothetical protein